jgi:hypothetical protein
MTYEEPSQPQNNLRWAVVYLRVSRRNDVDEQTLPLNGSNTNDRVGVA